MKNNFYKINELQQHKYYQVPKELFTNPRYKNTLNTDAKMLYAMLLDRMELSRANNWIDDDGTIFLIFKREDLAEMLGICTTTVWRAIKQLKEVGLLAEKRQGLNKPNLIYIGKIDYSTPEQTEHTEDIDDSVDNSNALPTSSENTNDGDLNNKGQGFEKVKGNNTDISKTENKIYKA